MLVGVAAALGVQAQDVVLFRQIGEKGDMAILKPIPKNDSLTIKFEKVKEGSFLKQSLRLNQLVQLYLKNTGRIRQVEPAYLALTPNVGGFSCKGCWLADGRRLERRPNMSYVDLQHSVLDNDMGKLMALPQFFTHELAHVMQQSIGDSRGNAPRQSVDGHYFNVITDYHTAFSEGWAEHWENVARLYEANPTIRRNVDGDAALLENKTTYARVAFGRDLQWPFRLNAFVVTMPMWYQWYENVKRYTHANRGCSVYACKAPSVGNLDMRLAYRNAGLLYDTTVRANSARLYSTEGFVSTLLLRITQSELGKCYEAASFYKPFQTDPSKSIGNPSKQFTPVENQLMKYVVVIAKYVKASTTNDAPIVQFLNGYMAEFPSERAKVLSIYACLVGRPYDYATPSQVWLMAKNYSHSALLIDQSGTSNIPFYAFNLNAADAIDLQTIKGLDDADAQRIVSWRDSHGYFISLDAAAKVPGLSDVGIAALKNAAYNAEIAERSNSSRHNFKNILMSLVGIYLLRALGYLALAWLLILVWFRDITIRRGAWRMGSYMVNTVVTFLLYLLFVLMAIITFSPPWVVMVCLSAIITGIAMFVYRKSGDKRRRALAFNAVMLLMVIYSTM